MGSTNYGGVILPHREPLIGERILGFQNHLFRPAKEFPISGQREGFEKAHSLRSKGGSLHSLALKKRFSAFRSTEDFPSLLAA